MKKRRLRVPFRPVYPSPAALVTSTDDQGNANVLTLAEVFNVSIRKPVIVGLAIRQATYSYGLIVKAGEFVVNLPPVEILMKVDQAGCSSGRDVPDKIERMGLTALPAQEVRSPLIAECPVNIECRVLSDQVMGDHNLILGEVVAMHVDEDKLNDQENLLTDKLDFLSYVCGEYWSSGRKLGVHGMSEKKDNEQREFP